ncbi:unnamed protein product [Vitrella brassicaformis CCMP3155]|uniref:DUF4291 domain-containing protein n=1 Tax=Vitrella brassicaformis (strain CCMP3155) TaxID=1169540 RepID=A0A0G4EX75_VITBC|nr:unnamed protein product [Vitrella brassicaformis CCMP3155]|eukprot:CEM03398.1 unnamed protein product [Vitrella brassicaformis CCMP3155]
MTELLTEAQAMTRLQLSPYAEQRSKWPAEGKHILAQFDDETVTVYQAYNPFIADYAVEHQRFGGDKFSFNRMSWIKTNFTWMMCRCGWASKKNQERVLALRLRRCFFDRLLGEAVHSSYQEIYGTREAWKAAIGETSVVMQWDPDHVPFTNDTLPRRAIQLGVRGDLLREMCTDALGSVEDVTDLVHTLDERCRNDVERLCTPTEDVYPVADDAVRFRLLFSHACGKNAEDAEQESEESC